MVPRLAGAFARALLVCTVLAAPSVLLVDVAGDAKPLAALFALFAGVFVFVEYNAECPSLIDYRDAPPLNRLRFGLVGAIVLGLCLIERGQTTGSTVGELLSALAGLAAALMDFPYSPLRLGVDVMGAGAAADDVARLREAAAFGFGLSLLVLLVFAAMVKLGGWPLRGRAFNFWVNLPTFDPSAGRDIVARLERRGWANVTTGCILPFVMPFMARFNPVGGADVDVSSPQVLIWVVVLWAALPVIFLMRGMAMGRIAAMIRDMRALQTGGLSRGFAAV